MNRRETRVRLHVRGFPLWDIEKRVMKLNDLQGYAQ